MPTSDVRSGMFSKRPVMANHTHTWWYNMSPINRVMDVDERRTCVLAAEMQKGFSAVARCAAAIGLFLRSAQWNNRLQESGMRKSIYELCC